MQNKCMQNRPFRSSVEIKVTRLYINFWCEIYFSSLLSVI